MLYIDYLHQIGGKLFYGAGTYWYVYHKALVRASNVPEFINMDHQTARQLLFQSGALFIRWSSHPSNQVTPWWWMICDHYDFARLRSNMRNQIRRGYKECTVQRVSVQWLADSGYECYKNAFLRYRHTTPANEDDFKAYILGLAGCDTLFECWAVFAKDRLAGYAICTVEEQRGVSMTDIKYDPAFLKCYSSYAMIDTLLKEYVVQRGLQVNNGTRSIVHDTNIQDFLLKFGFWRQYCRLNLQYRSPIGLAVSVLYPFRKLLPGWELTHGVRALLFQEELKRACNSR